MNYVRKVSIFGFYTALTTRYFQGSWGKRGLAEEGVRPSPADSLVTGSLKNLVGKKRGIGYLQ